MVVGAAAASERQIRYPSPAAAMNVFELGFAVLTVVGGIVGGTKGYAIHGGIGALLGVLVGAAAGLAIAFAVAFLLAVVCSVAFGGPLFKPRPPKGDG